MKIGNLHITAIVLLLLCCVGCYQGIPSESGNEVKIENHSTANADKKDERKAYQSILSGEFTLINDDDCKSEMEYLYRMDSKNGKCEWKYIFMYY